MWLRNKKTEMPSPKDALPGRVARMSVPDTHYVNGNRLEPPFPDGLELAMFGMGCFWGAERRFWEMPGVWSTSVGYAGGHTPNPTYEEVCSGTHRPQRGGPGRLRAGGRGLRRPAPVLLGEPRPDPGHAPGQRRRHPVPVGDLLHLRGAGDGRRRVARCVPGRALRGGVRPHHDRGPGKRRSTTTRRTTTSSTSRRSRGDTAGWVGPGSRSRPPSNAPEGPGRPRGTGVGSLVQCRTGPLACP